MDPNPANRDMESRFSELDASKGWATLYQSIRNLSSPSEYSIKEAKKADNKNLNRYRDVSPYDHSRVKLLRGDKDYINASRLEVPEAHRAYILTQGPLPNTTGHFWQMVWEQNCKAVLMLNKVIEKNTIKCHQYWPLGPKFNGVEVMDLEPVGLRVEFVSENEASYYTIRHLRLTDLKSGESRVITHFHYTMWPDFSVPQSPAAFLNFLFAVRESGALDQNVGPPVVHCSAGIGRSGTFCLVDSCLVLIEKAQDLNAVDVKAVLLSMRKSRMGLIQTPDQLRFSYLAIIEGAKRVLNQNQNIVNNGEEKVRLKRPSALEPEDIDDDPISRSSDDAITTSEGQPNSSSSSSSSNSSDLSPPVLPAKRGRFEVNCQKFPHSEDHQDDDDDDDDEEDDDEEEDDEEEEPEEDLELNPNRSSQNNNQAVSEDKERNEDKLCVAEQGKNECNESDCKMTMKDGAVVTNFSEKLREAEVRKRLRKEKNEKMREKLSEIQIKQRENEKWIRRRKSIWKPVSCLAVLLGGGYLVYRYFCKY